MPKSLLRIIVFLLVPCLLVDPSMAGALGHSAGQVERPNTHALFQDQALTLPFTGMLHVLAGHAMLAALLMFGTGCVRRQVTKLPRPALTKLGEIIQHDSFDAHPSVGLEAVDAALAELLKFGELVRSSDG